MNRYCSRAGLDLDACAVIEGGSSRVCFRFTLICPPQGIFRVKSMFMGANVRKATNEGRADYVPVFLSETPLLFRRKYVDLDHAIVQVTDLVLMEHGRT